VSECKGEGNIGRMEGGGAYAEESPLRLNTHFASPWECGSGEQAAGEGSHLFVVLNNMYMPRPIGSKMEASRCQSKTLD
jgi:hypothetical protein